MPTLLANYNSIQDTLVGLDSTSNACKKGSPVAFALKCLQGLSVQLALCKTGKTHAQLYKEFDDGRRALRVFKCVMCARNVRFLFDAQSVLASFSDAQLKALSSFGRAVPLTDWGIDANGAKIMLPSLDFLFFEE